MHKLTIFNPWFEFAGFPQGILCGQPAEANSEDEATANAQETIQEEEEENKGGEDGYQRRRRRRRCTRNEERC